MPQDKFLKLFGSLCGGKTQSYATIDKTRLPDEALRLLQAYKMVLIGMTAVVLLLFVHMRLWSIAFGLPLIIGGWGLKGHFEKRLDPLLAPYISTPPR